MFESIMTPNAFIKPFPAFEDVFFNPVPLYRKHFLPLLSVDISLVYPDLDFWLHFATPIEPLLEGNVGDHTPEFHDFYNNDAQVAFQVAKGKYQFIGDFNFFAYESGAIFKAFPNREDEIHEDYRNRITSYERTREGFLNCGKIPWNADASVEQVSGSSGPFLNQLGGEIPFGNWGMEVPLNKSGKPFRFIGDIQGFSYCARAADGILLF